MATSADFHQAGEPRKQSRRLVTLLEACSSFSSAANVVVLPPESGDTAVDSDVEYF